ncbi:hypothetical protein D3C86_1422000 [compost metagenome]
MRAGTGLDDVAMVHNHDPIRHLTYDTEIMGDHQERHIFFGNQLVDEIENFILRGDVERRAGLIRDEELRLMQQRKPDQHALAHAARKLGRIGIHDPLGIGKLHAAQNRRDASTALCLGRVDAVTLVGKAHDIIEMRADLEYRIEGRQRVLHDQRKRRSLERFALPSRHGKHIPAIDDDGAGRDCGILRQGADDRLGGDRLARSGFTDQRHALAGGNREGDIAQHLPRAAIIGESDVEVFDLEKRFSHGSAFHVEHVTQTVAQKIETQRHVKHGSAGAEDFPPEIRHELAPVGNHRSEIGGRRFDAETEEAQRRTEEDDESRIQRRLDG